MNHKTLITQLVELYNRAQPHQYKITRRPDEEEHNVRACDAYAEADDVVPLAIEHTRVESFHSRKLDDARFDKVFGALQAELRDSFPCWVSLWIPTFALQPGQNWESIKTCIGGWLLQNVPNLPNGRGAYQVPGVPFAVTVQKDDEMVAKLVVGRTVPPSEADKRELVEKFCAALTDKNEQLASYRKSGAETILLIESDDIALMNLPTLYKAFLLAKERTPAPNVDQVWAVHTYPPEGWAEMVCFLGPDPIMDHVNPPHHMYGSRYRDDWWRAITEEKFAASS